MIGVLLRGFAQYPCFTRMHLVLSFFFFTQDHSEQFPDVNSHPFDSSATDSLCK